MDSAYRVNNIDGFAHHCYDVIMNKDDVAALLDLAQVDGFDKTVAEGYLDDIEDEELQSRIAVFVDARRSLHAYVNDLAERYDLTQEAEWAGLGL